MDHSNTKDNESLLPQNTLSRTGNLSKTGAKKEKHKNEPFYMKKRGLVRKADQLKKTCNAQLFIAIYKVEDEKMYTYQTDNEFNLQRVTELILNDVQTGAFLNKNKKFEDVDFEMTRHNLN